MIFAFERCSRVGVEPLERFHDIHVNECEFHDIDVMTLSNSWKWNHSFIEVWQCSGMEIVQTTRARFR